MGEEKFRYYFFWHGIFCDYEIIFILWITFFYLYGDLFSYWLVFLTLVAKFIVDERTAKFFPFLVSWRIVAGNGFPLMSTLVSFQRKRISPPRASTTSGH